MRGSRGVGGARRRVVVLVAAVLPLGGAGLAPFWAPAAQAATQRLVRTKAEWQVAIAKVAAPGTGCYHASYPVLRWHAVRCTVAPTWPVAPARPSASAKHAAPTMVGAGVDYSAETSGLISQATGSFQDVSPKITEKGEVGNTGPKIANAFSLQLNSQFFSSSPACAQSGNPSQCSAWQQFVYSYGSDSGFVYMQYWLINFNATCPSGWFTFAMDCYTNSSTTTLSSGPLTAKDLATVKMSGSATAGHNDGISVSVGSGKATLVTASDSVLDLSAAWNTAEWGVFGDGNGGEAFFGTGTTLEAKTALSTTSSSAPACIEEGFTAETTNLKLTSTPALGLEPSPTIASKQTNGTSRTPSCAVAPRAPVAYVANGASGTVTPISTATDKPGKPIKVGSSPQQIAITPNGQTAYVVNSKSNTVTPIATGTNKAGKAISVGKDPREVLITPNGQTAYVLNYGSDSVTPIATASNLAGTPIPVGKEPWSMAITPNGQTIYVADLGSKAVTPIATATNTPEKPIGLSISPWYIAITPNGDTAYVTGHGTNSVVPIATASNAPGRRITVGARTSLIAITPNGKTVYVENGGSGTVTAIATASNKPGKAIRFAPQPAKTKTLTYPIVISPNSKTVYVLNVSSDAVIPIATAKNTVGKAIIVGKGPDAIAFAPTGKIAYVANARSGTVTPIATANNKPGKAIKVGSSPDGIAITP